uniref:Uncharacterized protein n=1 Tax=Romanomermis culicivorax TaxID=13658 RepID=A0A915IW19_ROMCU
MKEGELHSLLSKPLADCESSISSLDSLNYKISNDKEIILEPVSSSDEDEQETVDTPGVILGNVIFEEDGSMSDSEPEIKVIDERYEEAHQIMWEKPSHCMNYII